MQADVILQGPIHQGTFSYARSYAEIPFINRVIISTWEGEPELPDNTPAKLFIIHTPDVENPGQNNRNRQIVSTQKGLEYCTAPVIVKTRTDQHIRRTSWFLMRDYFKRNYKIDKKFVDGTGPKGAIFAIGLYTKFVFHPQDHLFFGWAEDIRALFDLPLDPKRPRNPANPGDNVGVYSDWAHTDTRPNAYLGMYYYARFDDRIRYMVENYQDFVVDNAPYREEALAKDQEYRDKIFKVFPVLDVYWQKYGCNYPYHWGVPFTEYHA